MRNEDVILNYNRPAKHTDRPKSTSAAWHGGTTSDVFSRSPEQLRAALRAQGINADKIEIPKTRAELEALSAVLQSYILGDATLAAKFDANLEAEAKKDARTKVVQQQGKEALSDRFEKGWFTAEESQRAHDTGMAFTKAYPQVAAASQDAFVANANAIIAYIRENRLNPIEIQSYVTAFHNLTLQGRLILNPSKINLGPQTDVGGQELLNVIRKHPEILDPFDSATMAKRKLDAMSAEEFYEQCSPEDKQSIIESKYQQGVPKPKNVREEQSFTRAVNSFLSLNPNFPASEHAQNILLELVKSQGMPITHQSLQAAYRAALSSGAIKPLTENDERYGNVRWVRAGANRPHQHGQSIPTNLQATTQKRQTLQDWINRKSSAAFQTRLERDPVFRRAVDSGDFTAEDHGYDG